MQLGNVATYINGYAFKPSDYSDTGLPIIRIQDLTGNVYQTNCYAGDLPEKYAVDDGDILISWSASLGVFEWDGGPAWLNQHIFKVSFDKMQVDKRFFVHQARFLMEANANLAHGATMRHLTKKVFDSLPFFFPRAERQKAIADQLDGIDIQLCNATNQLCHLDSLIKSRFIEMFGDIDDTIYEVKRIQDCCERIKDGTHQTPSYVEEGDNSYLFLSSKNVVRRAIDWSTAKYIPEALHRELHSRVSPRKGDILLAKNGTTGICAIVDRDCVFDIYVSLALIRPLGFMDSTYFWAAINADRTKRQFDSRLKGVGVPNLHLGEIRETLIVVPPLNLQKQFAAFAAQVDKLRFAGNHEMNFRCERFTLS